MANLSASRIVVESLIRHVPSKKFELKKGLVVKNALQCDACGVDMHPGDTFFSMPSTKSFTDAQYLSSSRKGDCDLNLCPHCALVMSSGFLGYQEKIKAAVYSERGAWTLTKDAQLKGFLLNPPEAPFVVYWSMSKSQHVVWRAPITLHRDFILFGMGRNTLSIDRLALLDASVRMREFTHNLAGCKDEHGRLLLDRERHHVFASLDRRLENSGHGVILPKIKNFLFRENRHHDIEWIEGLDEGILWGLSILNKEKQEEATSTTIESVISAQNTEC